MDGEFGLDDVAKSYPVSYRTIKQYGGTTRKVSLSRVCVEGKIFLIWNRKVEDSKISADTRGQSLKCENTGIFLIM